MPPPSLGGNHTISSTLLERLYQIVARNGGMVPLHARLFAQWMHHVFPKECPYPHMPGTTIAIRHAAFQNKTGKNATFSKEDMAQCIAGLTDADAGSNEVPWSEEDALYVEPPAIKIGISESLAPLLKI